MGSAPVAASEDTCSSRQQRVSPQQCQACSVLLPCDVLACMLRAITYGSCWCRLSGLDWEGDAAGGAADSVCYLQAHVQQSAKSFSFASQRRQQLEQAEKAHAAQQASVSSRPSSIKYDNINQFSQKVELYRGRCVC